jgi:hypothetical protein
LKLDHHPEKEVYAYIENGQDRFEALARKSGIVDQEAGNDAGGIRVGTPDKLDWFGETVEYIIQFTEDNQENISASQKLQLIVMLLKAVVDTPRADLDIVFQTLESEILKFEK